MPADGSREKRENPLMLPGDPIGSADRQTIRTADDRERRARLVRQRSATCPSSSYRHSTGTPVRGAPHAAAAACPGPPPRFDRGRGGRLLLVEERSIPAGPRGLLGIG